MPKRKKYIILLIICGFFQLCFSQNENRKWIFANNAGLDFSTNPPSVFSNSLSGIVGNAAISDQNGNLLFYTNGATVYDQAHNVMGNGTGLQGWGGSSLIVKKPGNNQLYYIFTIGTPTANGGNGAGLRYSIVDMSLAAGMGSVTVKNTTLNPNSGYHITASHHCNGTDTWILSADFQSNQLNAFLLTTTGISSNPVISTGGLIPFGTEAALRFSPSGQQMAILKAQYNNPITLELWNFNKASGALSNPVAVATGSLGNAVEFSPDNTKLYSVHQASNNNTLYQWDLCAGTTSAISASRMAIHTSSVAWPPSYLDLLLAPNGKIYLGRELNSTVVGEINNPNLLGTACNFNEAAVSLSPCTGGIRLGNFVQIFQKSGFPQLSFSVAAGSSCQQMSFNSNVLPGAVFGCGASTFTLQSLQWDFGDPLTGGNNSSTATSPTHTFTSTGVYPVKLVLDFGCGFGTDTITQQVTVSNSCFSISSTSITCASLGSATVTPLIPGSFTYTWLPVLQTGPVAGSLIPGTYTVLVNDAQINYIHTLTTTFYPLVPFTGNLSQSGTVSCNGASTGTASMINLAGGSGNQYYSWTNGTLTHTNASPTNLSAGIWTVTVTDALTACTIRDIFIMDQAPATTLSITANTPTACAESNITFNSTATGGTGAHSYQWTNGPPAASFVASQISGGHYIYSLTATDANTCSTTKTIAVDFISNPVLTLNSVSVCPLETGTLLVSGANSYTWSNASISNSISNSPTTTTQYSVTGSALGCTSIATASIIVKPLLVPLIASNGPHCENRNLKLFASGGSSYHWAGPLNFTSSAQNPVISSLGLTHSGIYNLTITAANSCTAATNINIIVNPTPTLSATGSTVCTTQTASLYAVSPPGSSHQWSGPGLFTSSLQNPLIINPAVAASGKYSLTVTSTAGCTNTAFADVLIVAPPSLTAQLSSHSLCSQAFNGSPNTITLTAGGANIYSLVTVPDLFNPNPSGPVFPLTAIPPNTGIGTGTLSGSNGICAIKLGFTFAIIPNPTVSVNNYTPEICAGQNFTYTNFGANSYTWNSATPNFTTYNNGGVAVAHPSINAVFSVYGSSLGCNSASKTSSITVYPIPTIFISPVESKICLGTSTMLTASGTSTDFYWQPKTGLNQVNGSSILASPLSEQTYTIVGTANNCTNTAIANVSVLPLPKPVAVASKQLYCANETVTLTGSGGETYYWNGPDNLKLGGQIISFPAFSATQGDFTLTVTDKSLCVNKTKVTVNIAPLPQGSLAGSKMESCVPFCSEYYYHNPLSDKQINVSWKINNQLIGSKTFTHCFTKAGENTVLGIFTDTLTNCVLKQEFIVKGLEVPVADFTWIPEKPIEGLEDVVFVNNSYGEKQNKFLWHFINNEGYTSENENTSYFFARSGDYPIAYIVQNQFGCADTVVKYITIEPDFNFYMPNSFTPNGDDRNDLFIPVMRGIKFYTFMVFDRWGEKIFETSDPVQGWNGTLGGESCKQDVYGWKVSLSTVHGESRVYSGSVTLMR